MEVLKQYTENLNYFTKISDIFPVDNLYIINNKFSKLDSLLYKELSKFEYFILIILLKYEYKFISNFEDTNLLEIKIFISNIIYFFNILQKLNWEKFCIFTTKLNNINIEESNLTIVTLNALKNIYNIKKYIDLYLKDFLSYEQLKLFLITDPKTYNLSYIFSKLNINFLENKDLNIKLFFNLFTKMTLGFYDSVINKYLKFYNYIYYDDNLSLLTRKKYSIRLNYLKGNFNTNIIYDLAIKYIGKYLKLPFARKPFSLGYRSYRIFLYTFNLKPKDLRKITIKGRDFKNGGNLIDQTYKFQLNIETILLLSNFCYSIYEVRDCLKNSDLVINGKLINNKFYKLKPYDILHFTKEKNKISKFKFLSQLLEGISNTFNEINFFFEYGFNLFCFILLPGIFKLTLSPQLFEFNSGRLKHNKK